MKEKLTKLKDVSPSGEKAQYECPQSTVYEMELEGFIADSGKVGSMSYDGESWNE